MKIEAGGAISNLKHKATLEEIAVVNENKAIHLWLNKDMLSYLNIQEAIGLRDELNRAIKQTAGV